MSIKEPDKDAYDEIWEIVVKAGMQEYLDKYPGLLLILPAAKEEIWQEYRRLNIYCKKNYMEDSEKLLDRHKVAACYMLAIAEVKPLRHTMINPERKETGFNERLAITVGLSILRAFVIADIEADEELSSDDKRVLIAAFENGIKIPDERFVNHGDYLENYTDELYFAIKEGKGSILSIAHELFLLEVYTKLIGDSHVEKALLDWNRSSSSP